MTPGRRSVGPQGLLSGIRVVELAQVLAGPFCGQHLADAGADVIKVEPPGGDGTRQWGPPYLKECEPRPGYPGDSAYYACCNRNKRGIAVDLTTKSGREVVRRLIRDADVVIENGSPSTMASWGLTYDACRESNEGLVWASITGYGSTGPDQGLPGYDFAVQAGAGLMSITGDVDGPPMKVGVAVSDLATGATAAIGILAALTGRQRTGRGGHVEVSLLETQVSWLANVASNYLVSGKEPQRFGNGHPNVVPYQLFMARDREIALAVGNDGQFKRLCTVLGTESLVTDPRFISNQARVANREVLVAMIAEAICARPAKDWVDLMRAARVPVELVRSIGEVMNDPQVRHRGLIVDLEHPAAGPFSLLGSAISFDGVTGVTPQPPPMFSEHTVEVLTEAGFTPAEVDALIQSNAVVQAVMPTRSVQGVPS